MQSHIRAAVATVTGLMLTGLVGCQTTSPSHEEHVNAANKRWSEIRAGTVLQMAQQQFDAGDLDQAERTLVQAIAIDSEIPTLHLLSGRVALERGQLERAYHRLDKAIELDADLAPAYYYQGVVLQRWSRYETALARYTKAYELQPDNVAYLLARAEMMVELEQIDDAMTLLEDKLTYFDQNAAIRLAMAHMHLIRHEFDRAADYFQQALLLQPDDTKTLEELASAQLASGQTDQAIRILERLTNDPELLQRNDLKRSLATAYFASGRTDNAKALCMKLVRTDPNDVESWIKLAEIAWLSDDQPGALLISQRVRALAPNRHEGYLLAGLVLQKRGQNAEALEMLDRAAALAPAKSTEPLILRGIALEANGRFQEAEAAYAEAARRQPDDVYAQRLLARLAPQP